MKTIYVVCAILLFVGIVGVVYEKIYLPEQLVMLHSDFGPVLNRPNSGFADIALDPEKDTLRIKRQGAASLPASDNIAGVACKLKKSLVHVRVYAPTVSDFATTTQPPEYERACP